MFSNFYDTFRWQKDVFCKDKRKNVSRECKKANIMIPFGSETGAMYHKIDKSDKSWYTIQIVEKYVK